MDKHIFFQSSMPRAGSTLLQNIIGQNPLFYVTPSSGVADIISGARLGFSNSPDFKREKDYNLSKKSFYNFCKEGINGLYKTITHKPYILDKSRMWLTNLYLLKKIYSDPKIIFMVRDLRDIISSFEKIYRNNIDATISIENTGNKHFIFQDRLNYYFTQPPFFPMTDILHGLLLSNDLDNIHFVKFEDLCLNPTYTINNIYNFLNLPYYNHDFNNIDQITWESDSVVSFGTHTISPTLSFPPSDYKTILGESVSNQIYDRYTWYFEYFNYKK